MFQVSLDICSCGSEEPIVVGFFAVFVHLFLYLFSYTQTDSLHWCAHNIAWLSLNRPIVTAFSTQSTNTMWSLIFNLNKLMNWLNKSLNKHSCSSLKILQPSVFNIKALLLVGYTEMCMITQNSTSQLLTSNTK